MLFESTSTPKVWAILPARSGSKRMPNKNLSHFNGVPLVTNTLIKLDTINMENLIIILTSDSNDILKLSNDFDKCRNHKRSESSTDTATADDVIIELLKCKDFEFDFEFDWILYCQPTSPLIKTSQYLDAIKLGLESDKNIISVSDKPLYLDKMLILDSEGRVDLCYSYADPTRNAQEAKHEVYIPNGAVYFFKIRDFRKANKFPIVGSLPLMMAAAESIDIDNLSDLELAERIYNDEQF